MNNTNTTISRTTGTSKLVRAKFGPGMLLQHEDLELLNSYTRDLSRLMFKSLFGCGVVCGLVVEPTTVCNKPGVKIGAGVALTCSGDPIYVPEGASLELDQKCDDQLGEELWVILCQTVKCCAPRTTSCSSDDDEVPSVCTREIEGYEIRIVKGEPYGCSCLEKKIEEGAARPENQNRMAAPTDCQCVEPDSPCYEKHYKGECGCDCTDCKNCDCDCVLLARLEYDKPTNKWNPKHEVRRFVRPVLMKDWQTLPKSDQVEPAPPPAPAPPDKESKEMRVKIGQLEKALVSKGNEVDRLKKALEKARQKPDANAKAADAAAAKLAGVVGTAASENPATAEKNAADTKGKT